MIERLPFSLGNFNSAWERINMQNTSFYGNTNTPIAARQGAGMC